MKQIKVYGHEKIINYIVDSHDGGYAIELLIDDEPIDIRAKRSI